MLEHFSSYAEKYFGWLPFRRSLRGQVRFWFFYVVAFLVVAALCVRLTILSVSSRTFYTLLMTATVVVLTIGLLTLRGYSVLSHWGFYVSLLIVAYAVFYGLQPDFVISPFHGPVETKQNLPFSGETAAAVLSDALNAIQRVARGERPRVPCLGEHSPSSGGERSLGPFLEIIPVEMPRPANVEVKGISLAAVVSVAHEIFGTEQMISGDIILEGSNGFGW
jgi:hypothetical protein